MKQAIKALLFTFLVCSTFGCIDRANSDEQPLEPELLELYVNDFEFIEAGMAWANDFDPTDLAGDNETHVNYTGTFSTKPLIERDLGDKTWFGLNPRDTGKRVWLGYNLISPIIEPDASIQVNLLGGLQERIFHYDDFQREVVDNDYHFGQVSLAIEDLNTNSKEVYLGIAGTITVSGNAPNYIFEFDMIIRGGPESREGKLKGRISPPFRVIDRR